MTDVQPVPPPITKQQVPPYINQLVKFIYWVLACKGWKVRSGNPGNDVYIWGC